MFQHLKMSLAPSLVGFGIQAYWAGKPGKALKRFKRAQRWWPTLMCDDPLFRAYLGLTHAQLGHHSEALPLLECVLSMLENNNARCETSEMSVHVMAEIQVMMRALRAE